MRLEKQQNHSTAPWQALSTYISTYVEYETRSRLEAQQAQFIFMQHVRECNFSATLSLIARIAQSLMIPPRQRETRNTSVRRDTAKMPFVLPDFM
ncbi:uncharacterized protein CIMG_13686 [Coccidioides immitis RS]|uniref:Uncharacterized protein n=1 Tax=Coccidioides immitis (strain RS) TaxID=246410 RepID=A0A0D8JVV7_COCIM|nr:uncharacterized protein CIMG_13686 [Coccidioides immitis RS]KJF61460.1 hypothetical protein CIMG_13686 [Coccidioides immitis RS]